MTAAKPIDLTGWDDEVQGRFESKVQIVWATGCMVWTAATDRDGYGQFWWRGRKVKAHRLAWVLENGEVPDGLQLDHLCRVRCCVNPDHLEPVSHRENLLRGDTLTASQVARTHCPAGHPLVDGNLVASSLARGRRACLTCDRQQSRERAALVKAAHDRLGWTQKTFVARFGESRAVLESVLAGEHDHLAATA